LLQDELAPVGDLPAKGFDVAAKSPKRSIRALTGQLGTDRYFFLEPIFQRIDERFELLRCENGLADFTEARQEPLAKFGIGKQRTREPTWWTPPACASPRSRSAALKN